MISDSTTTSINEEGLVSLIFEMELMDLNLDTLIKIDAIADAQTHTLDSATFSDVVISDTATIGEAINEIPLGTILLPDGSTNSIPAMPNIANGDTPNFQSLDINFQDALKEKLALWRGNNVTKDSSATSGLKRLEEREFDIAVKLSTEKKLDASRLRATIYTEPNEQERLDSNSVDVDREMAKLMENSYFHRAYLEIYNKKSRMMRMAITGRV